MHILFKQQLLDRERLVGTLLTLPTPELAEIAADAGFDWLFLDMEHGLLDSLAVQRIAQAVGERCPCVVRVPLNEEVWIKKALDAGVAGLIFPHLNTRAEAERVVRMSLFSPEGERSISLARASRFGLKLEEYLVEANRSTSFIAQVEHIEAVRNIDEIITVPGIDAVLVGPYDLSASLKKPGQVADAEVQGAIKQVRKACDARNVPAGIFAGDTAAAEAAFRAGYSFVCVATDITLFSRAAAQTVRDLKSC
ncbi:MAG: 2,4-dihydroxyhept-2-ene-1,7-dioic acid aldolase [Candidatus Aminicenantes bacterium]|nr:2,4-dihydroxyhept-2-ene-1,7-dioic acid aldolase [Candidatus Aminicenantes bacterium]